MLRLLTLSDTPRCHQPGSKGYGEVKAPPDPHVDNGSPGLLSTTIPEKAKKYFIECFTGHLAAILDVKRDSS